ncbi:MAG: 1-phosphofructokinase family hexose kinase, partial [Vallitaleaceae bacterium]|nr:1-phosphofructokinase family hexose kinase [Vallitaleaceae bacterium]
MIYTVTLNPAIDKTVSVNGFEINEVNRVTSIREDAGGKGINVSKMINNFGGQSKAVLLAGGDSGRMLMCLMDDLALSYHVIANSGTTRTNVKVVDSLNHTFTDINEPGPNIDADALGVVDTYLNENLTGKDILVLAGSVPSGVPKDIYKHWCDMASHKGAKVILDADGEVFREGIKGKPYIIKPNQMELEQYFDMVFEDDVAMVEKTKELIAGGIYAVAISKGSEGCVLVT